MSRFSTGCDFTDVPAHPDMEGKELAVLVKSADKTAFSALLSKYRSVISITASKFVSPDCDRDDLVQEGNIALYAAAISFEEGKGASFDTYASVCIRHRMKNYADKVLRSTRLTVSLDESKETCDTLDPQSFFEEKYGLSDLFSKAESKLSSLEKRVFSLYAEGHKVREIASLLSISSKSVENAMARIRKKFRK